MNKALFFNIKTNTKIIRLSGTHLVSIPNGQFRFAKLLSKGDYIVTFDPINGVQTEELIQSITIVTVKGYAAPLTMSGTILIDNILTSCYAVVDNHYLAHSSMAPVRWWYNLNTILRPIIPEALSVTFKIDKQSNGTHWFPAFLHYFQSSLIDWQNLIN